MKLKIAFGFGLSLFATVGLSVEFNHGIASGDPLSDRVILWTRITPAPGHDGSIPYSWQVAEDASFQTIVAEGSGYTDSQRDFTVKVDAAGLAPQTRYLYRFQSQGYTSPVGYTKTLPAADAQVDSLSLLLSSCSNYPYGYFYGYREMAREGHVDAVLHLGDYLYEYADKEYGDGAALGRTPQPNRELVTLADYRQRHAQYKSDPDLQLAHAAHPFLVIWDDHESANDAWIEGAENHSTDSEGSWQARRAAAVKAYQEWMPTRDTDGVNSLRSYRSFRWGKLASLILLDTRLIGRDQQVSVDDPQLTSSSRQLLGLDQERWVHQELQNAGSAGSLWQIIGQQVMFSPLRTQGKIYNTDQWDGYPAARTRLWKSLQAAGRKDTLILAGDIHSSWISELTDRDILGEGDAQAIKAVEIVTPGLSSPSVENPVQAEIGKQAALSENKHFAWADLFHRGYVRLDVRQNQADVRWILLDDVRGSSYELVPGPSYRIPRGSLKLQN